MGSDYFLCFDKITYIKGKRPQGCILCLIRGGSPDVVDLTVYSDDLFSVSVNLYPYNPGHCIVFPRRHITDVRELNTAESERLSGLQNAILGVLDSLYTPMGYNLGYNMGLVAGASISHLHLHIIPRYANETGISDLIAGKRVMIESPYDTQKKIKEACASIVFEK